MDIYGYIYIDIYRLRCLTIKKYFQQNQQLCLTTLIISRTLDSFMASVAFRTRACKYFSTIQMNGK